jgi:hypothetical protein
MSYAALEGVKKQQPASLPFQEGEEPETTHEEPSDKSQVIDSLKNNWPLIFKNNEGMKFKAIMADCSKLIATISLIVAN